METINKMREASAPVPCDHVLTLDEAIAHAEECADDTPCGSQHRQLADWLKELKTLKTSVSCGNAAKMREALEMFVEAMDYHKCVHATMLTEAYQKAKAALSAPPRNCDVGSAEEQVVRHHKEFCAAHNRDEVCCAQYNCEYCFSRWAQMPCEEGGEK